jgi:prevent-host-death family protein
VAQINIAEAKAKLSALADRAAAGEEIILAKAGRPVARIMALAKKEPRRPGVARHWIFDHDALMAPSDPEDLDAAEGLHTDEVGITRREPD